MSKKERKKERKKEIVLIVHSVLLTANKARAK
jgi:hypothetical protein